jgi:hypothetical protein
MRVIAFLHRGAAVAAIGVAAIGVAAIGFASVAESAEAATKKNQTVVYRSAAGTIIQPTRTIIHHADGTTTVITVQRRSYLDPGTEVPVGYGNRLDYAFPPGGDPGRPYWFYGPDQHGIGGLPLAQPWLIPGYNPHNPF